MPRSAIAAMPRIAMFAVASLLAIGCGALVIWQSGGGLQMALANLIGWAIGLIAAIAIWRASPIPRLAEIIVAATILALVASLFDPGLSGVHRWIMLGPLRVNVAALTLPAFVAVISRGVIDRRIGAVAFLSAMGLLLAQPDASQATALAATSPILFAHWPAKWRWPILAAVLLLAILSWFAHDPLEPVLEVEGIFGLALRISPVIAVLGMGALAATIMCTLGTRGPLTPLFAYCATIALMPILGHFPVPLVGAGVSFPLGWWLGIAIALHSQRSDHAQT